MNNKTSLRVNRVNNEVTAINQCTDVSFENHILFSEATDIFLSLQRTMQKKNSCEVNVKIHIRKLSISIAHCKTTLKSVDNITKRVY